MSPRAARPNVSLVTAGLALALAPGLAPAETARVLSARPLVSPLEQVRSFREETTGEAAPSGMSPRVKAMLLSALVPGLGQYGAGDRTWAFIFFGAEAAVWTTYAAFQIQGGQREDRYEEYAHLWAGVDQPKGHASTYYSDLGTFPTYEDYRVVAIRTGEGELYPEEQHWVWPSEERRSRFLDLRASSEDSYQRAEFMLAAALLNRAIAVVHAARSVSGTPVRSLSLEVLPRERGQMLPALIWRQRF